MEPARTTSAPVIHSYQQALDFLLGRVDYERFVHVAYGERHFKLDRMRQLNQRLGDPLSRLSVLHVAGSKGKGSTSAMLASMLKKCGMRTGLFTSPHLVDLSERIQIDGNPIDAGSLIRHVARLATVVTQLRNHPEEADREPPTFFELMTALGLLFFDEQKVDVVVLEVGLGGRLDSTNICTPECSVITSIGLDHTNQLGNTLAEIAAEKAGIIKPGVPVVSGVTEAEPRDVIRRRAAELQSPLFELGRDFLVSAAPHLEFTRDNTAPQRVDYVDVAQPAESLRGQQLSMLGAHQARNASLALMTCTLLKNKGWLLPQEKLSEGLAMATCPARVELISTAPAIVLDTAHTRASIDALIEALSTHTAIARKHRHVVVSITKGKDELAILRGLLSWFGHLYLTQYLDNPRAIPVEQLQRTGVELAKSNGGGCFVSAWPTPVEAWSAVHQATSAESLICITGSFFLAAEIAPCLPSRDS